MTICHVLYGQKTHNRVQIVNTRKENEIHHIKITLISNFKKRTRMPIFTRNICLKV